MTAQKSKNQNLTPLHGGIVKNMLINKGIKNINNGKLKTGPLIFNRDGMCKYSIWDHLTSALILKEDATTKCIAELDEMIKLITNKAKKIWRKFII